MYTWNYQLKILLAIFGSVTQCVNNFTMYTPSLLGSDFPESPQYKPQYICLSRHVPECTVYPVIDVSWESFNSYFITVIHFIYVYVCYDTTLIHLLNFEVWLWLSWARLNYFAGLTRVGHSPVVRLLYLLDNIFVCSLTRLLSNL